jgi:hypothetical protein
MTAKLHEIAGEILLRMHQSIPEQGEWLQQAVSGYFGYHAVPTNGAALHAFQYHVVTLWRRALQKRSQKAGLTRERISRLADDWLPQPRILYPWPNQRLAVRHPRWEPDAQIGRVQICAGRAQ